MVCSTNSRLEKERGGGGGGGERKKKTDYETLLLCQRSGKGAEMKL